jgi:hypothetical protein
MEIRSDAGSDAQPRMCRSLRGDGDEKSESEPEHAALSLRRQASENPNGAFDGKQFFRWNVLSGSGLRLR